MDFPQNHDQSFLFKWSGVNAKPAVVGNNNLDSEVWWVTSLIRQATPETVLMKFVTYVYGVKMIDQVDNRYPDTDAIDSCAHAY